MNDRRKFSLSTAALMLFAAACSVGTPADEAPSGDVSAELVDKVNAGCPGLIKPEAVAAITKGFEVAEVARGPVDDICTVSVQDGRQVLFVGLIGYPSKELAEQYVDMQCPGSGFEGADQSCKVTTRDGKNFKVHGVAGRWEVKISVSEVPMNDEVKDAAVQILKDLRNSDRTK